MIKSLSIILLILLFATTGMSAPLSSQPNILKEQPIQSTFLYHVFILDQEIIPAIYRYFDLSNFKKAPTIEQQKEIGKNIETVFSAYTAKYKLDKMKVTLQLVDNDTKLMLFVYFYEYNSRSSQYTLASIGRQIPIFKMINNFELETME
ncbi:MAG: hypothetical protein GOV02_03070 [Candidatus Aenigmarchaeota archaeon]|nr:hypothetical protein [Candidatus Aenigmarchaeota archaeon]